MAEADATITVNGTRIVLACESVALLLDELGYGRDRPGIAVALNGDVVPRSRWADQGLQGGDAVEIVGAAQGG